MDRGQSGDWAVPGTRFLPGRIAAFSLTELLVVTAIIGVILSLMMPALVMSRRHGQTAECISNLRQIGFALENFAADNDDLFPRELMSDDVFKEVMSARHTGWSLLSSAYADDAEGRSMSGYYADKRVLRCPSMRPGEAWSYGMNGQVLAAFKRFRDLSNPSETPMVFDSEQKLGYYYSDLAMRHAGCAQVLFADTHVEPLYHDLLLNFPSTVPLAGGAGLGPVSYGLQVRVTGTTWDSVDVWLYDAQNNELASVTVDRRTGNPNDQAVFLGNITVDPEAGPYTMKLTLYVSAPTNPGGKKEKKNPGGNPVFLGIDGGDWQQLVALNKNSPEAEVDVTQLLLDAR